MPNSRPEIGSPEEWLRHAQSDLNLARLANGRADILPEQVCFHAQQAPDLGGGSYQKFCTAKFLW